MKEYRDKELKNLMFLLLFLFLIWCTPIFNDIDINTSYDKYHILLNTVESALVSATLSCATVLFDCLISPNLKDKLVGLFFIPRSGETIFSNLREGKIKDPRFFTVDAVVFTLISFNPSQAVKLSAINLRILNGTKFTNRINH